MLTSGTDVVSVAAYPLVAQNLGYPVPTCQELSNRRLRNRRERCLVPYFRRTGASGRPRLRPICRWLAYRFGDPTTSCRRRGGRRRLALHPPCRRGDVLP